MSVEYAIGPVTEAEKAKAEVERLHSAITKAIDLIEIDGDFKAACHVLHRAEEGE